MNLSAGSAISANTISVGGDPNTIELSFNPLQGEGVKLWDPVSARLLGLTANGGLTAEVTISGSLKTVSISASALQASITELQTSVSNLQTSVSSIPTVTSSSDSLGVTLFQNTLVKRLRIGPGLSATSTTTYVAISFNPTFGNGLPLWDSGKLLGLDVSSDLGIAMANEKITINSGSLGTRLTTAERTLTAVSDRNSPDVKSLDAGPFGAGGFWRLGTWNAEQGGHILRLRVTYCGYGYGVKFGTKMYYTPIDLNILIHTLDGNRLPTDTEVLSGAWGYAWFICGYAAPAYVYVSVNRNNIDQYYVYLFLGNNTGNILVEASTTATWTTNIVRIERPDSMLAIQCIPVQTHMSTTSTYKRSPPTMPFTTVP
jgi:hypothetical protein